jgi:hypothetical protein
VGCWRIDHFITRCREHFVDSQTAAAEKRKGQKRRMERQREAQTGRPESRRPAIDASDMERAGSDGSRPGRA